MECVLIVAKTHVLQNACVGGLVLETNKSVRLMTARGDYQPSNTPFEVGQIWDLALQAIAKIVPPHIEDVGIVEKKFIHQQPALRETLLQRVQPWQGGLHKLFDGLLVTNYTSAYINRAKGLPTSSTGYWLPDNVLTLTYRKGKPYYGIAYAGSRRALYIPYVGYSEPVYQIRPGTLVRVSLARWWVPADVDEERCYLQLSGWY